MIVPAAPGRVRISAFDRHEFALAAAGIAVLAPKDAPGAATAFVAVCALATADIAPVAVLDRLGRASGRLPASVVAPLATGGFDLSPSICAGLAASLPRLAAVAPRNGFAVARLGDRALAALRAAVERAKTGGPAACTDRRATAALDRFFAAFAERPGRDFGQAARRRRRASV